MCVREQSILFSANLTVRRIRMTLLWVIWICSLIHLNLISKNDFWTCLTLKCFIAHCFTHCGVVKTSSMKIDFGFGYSHVAVKISKPVEWNYLTMNHYVPPWKKWREGTNALKAKFISVSFSSSAFQTVFPSFHGSFSRFLSPTDFNWGRVLFFKPKKLQMF